MVKKGAKMKSKMPLHKKVALGYKPKSKGC